MNRVCPQFPPCEHRNPNIRRGLKEFWCEMRGTFVKAARSIKTPYGNMSQWNCAKDCPHRRGENRPIQL